MAREHSDVVVGIKSAHWWAPNFVSVQKAVEAGKLADIPVMVDFGFGFIDVVGGRIEGKQRLGCEMTVRAGKVVFDFNGRAGTPWRDGNLRYPEK